MEAIWIWYISYITISPSLYTCTYTYTSDLWSMGSFSWRKFCYPLNCCIALVWYFIVVHNYLHAIGFPLSDSLICQSTLILCFIWWKFYYCMLISYLQLRICLLLQFFTVKVLRVSSFTSTILDGCNILAKFPSFLQY